MGYYTVKLNSDNAVFDVTQTPIPCCKWTGRMVEMCKESDNPMGYSSERTGLIYHVNGWPAFPTGVTPTPEEVTLAEVSLTVYTQTKERLDREQKTSEELSAAVAKNTTDINYNQSIVDYNIMMGKLDDPEEEE